MALAGHDAGEESPTKGAGFPTPELQGTPRTLVDIVFADVCGDQRRTIITNVLTQELVTIDGA